MTLVEVWLNETSCPLTHDRDSLKEIYAGLYSLFDTICFWISIQSSFVGVYIVLELLLSSTLLRFLIIITPTPIKTAAATNWTNPSRPSSINSWFDLRFEVWGCDMMRRPCVQVVAWTAWGLLQQSHDAGTPIVTKHRHPWGEGDTHGLHTSGHLTVALDFAHNTCVKGSCLLHILVCGHA